MKHLLETNTEKEIERAAQKWRTMFDSISDLICLLDTEKRVVQCNRAMSGHLDRPFKNILGKTCCELFHGTAKPIEDCPFLRMMETSKRESLDCLMGDRWYNIQTDPVIDDKGNLAGAVHILKDITKHRQAEDALRQSEERHRILFEGSRDALMTLDPPSWKFTSGNIACVELFGLKDEAELTSLGPWALSPERQPDGRPSAEMAKEMIETAMKRGSNFFEWTHKAINGRPFPATVLLTRVQLGKKTFLQATVRDISIEKQAGEALRESEQRYRTLFDDANDGIVLADAKTGRIIECNQALCRMVERDKAGLLGQNQSILHPPSSPWIVQRSVSSFVSMATSSPMSLFSILRRCLTVSLQLSGDGSMGCLRLNKSSWRTTPPARPAARPACFKSR